MRPDLGIFVPARRLIAILFAILLCLFAVPVLAQTGPEENVSPDQAEQPEQAEVFAEPAEPPPTSILELFELPSDFQQTAGLYALLADSDAADLERFIKEAKTIADANDRKASLQIIYLRYLDIDPAAAIDHFNNMDGGFDSNHYYNLFFSWSRTDLDAAIQKVRDIHDWQKQQMAARGIIRANSHLNLDELRELAAEIGPMALGELNNLEGEKLSELAKTDPQAAMERLMSSDSSSRYQLMHRVAQAWAARDPDSLLAFSENLESPRIKVSFRHAALESMAKRDPEGMLKKLDASDLTQRERISVISSAAVSLAASDPYYAIETVYKVGRKEEREQAMASLVSYMGWATPDTAFEVINSPVGKDIIELAGRRIIYQLANIDLDKTLAIAKKYEAEVPGLTAQALNSVARSDPERVLDYMEEMPDSKEKERLMVNTIDSIARLEPIQAAELLQKIPPSQQQQFALRRVASTWFQQDADTALAWAFSLDGRDQAYVLHSMANEVARFDIEYAKSLLPMLPTKYIETRWISTIVEASSQEGNSYEIAQWLQDYSGHPNYGEWMNMAISATAAEDRMDDAFSMVELIPDPEAYDRAINSLVTSWAGKAPDDAAAWLDRELNLANRIELIKSTASQWGSQDMRGARQWVFGLKDSGERDQGLSALLANSFISQQDADQIIRKFMSADIRFTAMSQYLSELAKYDSQAATLFVQRQTMMADEKDRLFQVIEDVGNGKHEPRKNGRIRAIQ